MIVILAYPCIKTMIRKSIAYGSIQYVPFIHAICAKMCENHAKINRIKYCKMDCITCMKMGHVSPVPQPWSTPLMSQLACWMWGAKRDCFADWPTSDLGFARHVARLEAALQIDRSCSSDFQCRSSHCTSEHPKNEANPSACQIQYPQTIGFWMVLGVSDLIALSMKLFKAWTMTRNEE